MGDEPLTGAVRAYYDGRLEQHGPTAQGVDWNSAESQTLRFDQLLPIGWETECKSLLDYGCGYGALLNYLRDRNWSGDYTGYDLSPAMIGAARRQHGDDGRFQTESPVGTFGCTLASGLFNVRMNFADDRWDKHIGGVLDEMWSRTETVMAFNMLTSYSDFDRRRDDLFYADPRHYLDLCIRRYSRHARLHHGYRLYEFTIQVEA